MEPFLTSGFWFQPFSIFFAFLLLWKYFCQAMLKKLYKMFARKETISAFCIFFSQNGFFMKKTCFILNQNNFDLPWMIIYLNIHQFIYIWVPIYQKYTNVRRNQNKTLISWLCTMHYEYTNLRSKVRFSRHLAEIFRNIWCSNIAISISFRYNILNA